MPRIYDSATALIGSTPLLRLSAYSADKGFYTTPLAKLECLNPAGSVKDRAALYMIERACSAGVLRPGGLIVEPTSGNTGIGLASVGIGRGFRVILTMPDSMSVERRQMLAAYGAEIVLTPAAQGMQGALDAAAEIAAQNPGSFIPSQFENPANAQAHYETTGPEIWRDTDGRVDIFVATVGSGGTITGTGRYLKEQNPAVEIVAVEPADSPLLSGGAAGPHAIQGIGANFVPALLDRTVIDRVCTVTAADAFAAGREMARREGILVGISSGAALSVAGTLAREKGNAGKHIVVLLPDSGDRYLSSEMFAD